MLNGWIVMMRLPPAMQIIVLNATHQFDSSNLLGGALIFEEGNLTVPWPQSEKIWWSVTRLTLPDHNTILFFVNPLEYVRSYFSSIW